MVNEDIAGIKFKIEELKHRLKHHKSDRKNRLCKFKKATLLTDTIIREYGSAEGVKHLSQVLSGNCQPINNKKAMKTLATKCRNHLMVMLCLGNALRASNLINITMQDIDDATENEEFGGALTISSEFYKTSMLYGEKIILFPKAIFSQTTFYIKHLRKYLTDDSESPQNQRKLFTTASKQDMSNSVVSNCLTSAFKLSGVLQKNQ